MPAMVMAARMRQMSTVSGVRAWRSFGWVTYTPGPSLCRTIEPLRQAATRRGFRWSAWWAAGDSNPEPMD